MDELGSLEQISSLEACLTKGRKHGLRVVACLQSTSQLTALYGEAGARTLRSCFRTLLILGGTATDPDTAEALSRGLGDVEIDELTVSVSRAGARRTTSESRQNRTRRLVMPAEIQALPVNQGYLKLPGKLPVARITVRPPSAPSKSQPFVAR
jgi:type IV secretory pathway TraG/TraD family ATPase VirD4